MPEGWESKEKRQAQEGRHKNSERELDGNTLSHS